MEAKEIVEIIDEYLISTGKHFIGLRAANDLLNSKRKTDISLKSLLEKNEIPHAYQTETKPRQWRIPYSDETTYKEKRSEFLKNQPKVDSTYTNNVNNNNFTLRHFLIISIATLAIYFSFFDNSTKDNSTSRGVAEYYINKQAFTTYNKNDFDDMYNCVIHNDTKALQEMIDLGKIYILEEGAEVYLVDAGFGYDVVCEKGSTQKLWIATERLRKK